MWILDLREEEAPPPDIRRLSFVLETKTWVDSEQQLLVYIMDTYI